MQPQPVWIGLLTEGFMPLSGCWSLLTGIGVTARAIVQLGTGFPLQWWLWFAANLLASCTVALVFSFLWGALAFWAPLAAEENRQPRGQLLKAFPDGRLERRGAGRHAQRAAGRLIHRGRIAYHGDFVELRRRFGYRRHLTIETDDAAPPHLTGVRFAGNDGNRHHFTFDAARSPVTALLHRSV